MYLDVFGGEHTYIYIYTQERRYSLKVRKGIFNPQGTEWTKHGNTRTQRRARSNTKDHRILVKFSNM